MKLLDPNDPAWRKRFWAVLGVVVFVLLASHPELRLLLPFVDVVGLDLVVLLVGSQCIAFMSACSKSLFYRLWHLLAPMARGLDHATSTVGLLRLLRGLLSYGVFHWCGRHGPPMWFRLHRFFGSLQLGPGNALGRIAP